MRMPAHPVLMVLYTNDAVEVRYSDGTRLNVLPCGTAFSYHVNQDSHPVHGMKTHHQRCRYVTSHHKHKVLSALDFRNRFAERPYLCEELLEKDQVVPLYAKIKEIAWPKSLTNRNCERLEDGGIRVISDDQFASLVLSPHGRDFTLCYLSLLSQEKKREKLRVKGRQTGNHSAESAQSVGNSDLKTSKSKARDQPDRNQDMSPPSENKTKVDLNISPITQASCNNSPQALSNASGSPLTPQNVIKDDIAKYRPFSTPTRELEDDEEPVCTPYGKTAVFRDYRHKGDGDGLTCRGNGYHDNSSEGRGSPEFREISGEKMSQTAVRDNRIVENCEKPKNRHVMLEDRNSQEIGKMKTSRSRSRLCHDDVKANTNASCMSRLSDGSGHSEIDTSGHSLSSETDVRCLFCWVTKHISCDECPVAWSAVVRMASDVMDKGTQLSDEPEDRADNKEEQGASRLRRIKRSCSVFSPVPLPLSLVCPGQHLHKAQAKQTYNDGKNPLEDPTTLHQGRLKVLLVEGIVYRVVRLTSMKVVEVYPGDGTVLMSQGPSGHYFVHRIPTKGKVEERTYSLKSLPPDLPTAPYSVKSLIKRAHRFLLHANQEERTLPASSELLCWKHQELNLVEPLPCTILEECVVPGFGKFTALSNGQIRVVFNDRTALDLTWDFSERIQTCMEHSSEEIQHNSLVPDSKAGLCRLLLPSGQYQMVAVKEPGTYRRYVDMACEWGRWVNSSPAQRGTFYSKQSSDHNQNMSVQRELQRIQCFNYIVDSTVFKKPGEGDHKDPTGTSSKPQQERKGILRNTGEGKTACVREPVSYDLSSASSRQLQTQSTQSCHVTLGVGHSVQPRSLTGSGLKARERLNPVGQSASECMGASLDTMQGFNAVREALLRTSSVIKDIDDLLDHRKT